jgi:RimJ/RimL family protein N-acetyltransferase
VEESREWLLTYILNVDEKGEVDPGIDKFALLLKGVDGDGDGEGERDGKGLKMIGFVGTNRWCEQGLEVGYCLNRRYWGKGFVTEGFGEFLRVFWGLSGTYFWFLIFSFWE